MGGISGRSLTIEAHPEHEAAHSACQQPFEVIAKEKRTEPSAQTGKAKHPFGAHAREQAHEAKGWRVSIKKIAKKDTTGSGNQKVRTYGENFLSGVTSARVRGSEGPG